MPIYEYKCNDCGKCCSILHLPGIETTPACEGCGSENLKKVISNCNHKIKGYCHKNEYDGKKKAMADPDGWGEYGDG